MYAWEEITIFFPSLSLSFSLSFTHTHSFLALASSHFSSTLSLWGTHALTHTLSWALGSWLADLAALFLFFHSHTNTDDTIVILRSFFVKTEMSLALNVMAARDYNNHSMLPNTKQTSFWISRCHESKHSFAKTLFLDRRTLQKNKNAESSYARIFFRHLRLIRGISWIIWASSIWNYIKKWTGRKDVTQIHIY